LASHMFESPISKSTNPVAVATVGVEQYPVSLPLTPAEQFLASPAERFRIALNALDDILTEYKGKMPDYSALREEIVRRTGLNWAVAHLAIDSRRNHRLYPAPESAPAP
jgi:hypothetical protein